MHKNKKTRILYEFDCIKFENEKTFIKGWAFSKKDSEKIKINIYDKIGNLIKSAFVNMSRQDVVGYYSQFGFNPICGFEILLDIEPLKIGKICFQDCFGDEYIDFLKIYKGNGIGLGVASKLSRVLSLFSRGAYSVIVRRKFKFSKADVKKFWGVIRKTASTQEVSNSYETWIRKNAVKFEELEKQRNYSFKYAPKISILTPTYNTKVDFLDELVNSLKAQTYSDWELCIAEASTSQDTINRVKYWEKQESRVKVKFLEKNIGIGANTNEAASIAMGDYIGLCDHDDILPSNSLFEVVKAINENTDVDFIYSDEDKISEDGETRFCPFFKPDFSPDTFRSYNYICHFTVLEKGLFDKISGFREGFNGSQDYDLFLRATENAKKIVHIPKILYHWRACNTSVALNSNVKTYAFDSGIRALTEHIERVGLKGEVSLINPSGLYKIDYVIAEKPLVSIIIPNKDYVEDLKKCINSIKNISTYQNYEIIVVENNSKSKEIFEYYKEIEQMPDIKVIHWDKEFNFSSINNFAVSVARGKYLVFMNNDIEVITSNWIEEMLQYAQRDDVGIVGAKLYYPDKTVQHAGVIIGIGGCAGHSHKHADKEDTGYFGRLKIVQNLSAVTAACLMIDTAVFNSVGGFEESLKVAFNDVDLCLKVREKNKLIVFNPLVEMIHYESKSRGYEDTPEKVKRFENEVKIFSNRWEKVLKQGDPCYNVNLTLIKEDFSLK